MFRQQVISVAGNHEYYGARLGMLAELQKLAWEHAGVNYLDGRAIALEEVRFLGCTLWSGFHLYCADKAEACMNIAKRSVTTIS